MLKGNGIPGIGTEAARILVPKRFRVVESGNAKSFDMPQTLHNRFIRPGPPTGPQGSASAGLGKLLLGEQPTGLPDVTIVIGEDFGGA